MADWRIIELRDLGERGKRAAAEILVDAFAQNWPEAWPALEDGLREVAEALEEGRISRAAVDESGVLLGWIGAIPSYGGNVWEIHPLAVSPGAQRRGIGRALLADIEVEAGRRRVLTLWVGSDDVSGQTTLAGIDVYQDLPGLLATVRNLRQHPFEFYQRCGFQLAGVVPDANGLGMPDILLAKRVRAGPPGSR